MTTKLTML